MILVRGVNGHLGSMTIDHHLKKNPVGNVAGLVRSEEKGEGIKEKGVKKWTIETAVYVKLVIFVLSQIQSITNHPSEMRKQANGTYYKA